MTDTKVTNSPVLVAIDFSDDSRAALLWAMEYARQIDVPLILLHVVHDSTSYPGFYRQQKKGEMLPMQQVAEEMMGDFLAETRQEFSGVDVLQPVRTELVNGLPPGRIIEMAGILKAGIIVIGNRGLTGLPHLLLGSVAERVVELSTIPVVVVKANAGKDTK